MARPLNRAIWSIFLAFLGCLSSVCSEEEIFLLDDQAGFCGVPGTANVQACRFIIGEQEDRNPTLEFDFVCSRKEDCKNGSLEGQVVGWYSSGCNGPKIKNKLCGCCIFIPMPEDVAPGIPTNLQEISVTSTSVTLAWEDGSRGVPVETYTVRCFDNEPEDCTSTDFIAEETNIPRDTQIATISGLERNTEYTCFVLAVNKAALDGVCSDSVMVMTLQCETDDDCDGETPICDANQECTQADFEVSSEEGLRNTLAAAEPGQSIQVVGTITLSGGTLTINKAISIVGKRDSVLQSPADSSASITFISVVADDVSFSRDLRIRHLRDPAGSTDTAFAVNANNFVSAADVDFVEFGYSLEGTFTISGTTNYVGAPANRHRHFGIFSLRGDSVIQDVTFSFPEETPPVSNAIFVNTESGTFDGGLTVKNVIQEDLSIACRQFFNYEAGFATIVPGNSFLSFEENAWNDLNGGIFLIFPTDDPLQRFQFISLTNNFQGNAALAIMDNYKGIFYVTGALPLRELGDVSNFISSGNESPGQTDPNVLRAVYFWVNVPGQEEFTLAIDGRHFIEPTD